jgi:ferredoxin
LEKCPTGAFDLSAFHVDRGACVLCLGCINNCPAQAFQMEYSGQKLIDYRDFMKMKNLIVKEPEELDQDA